MNVKNTVIRLCSTAKIKSKKYGPKVGPYVGVGLLVGAGVWACKRSTKLPDLMNKHKEVIETIEDAKENDEDYSDKDAAMDTLTEYKHITVEVIKLYGAPVAIAVGGTVCIIGSHVILSKRNAALASAYTIVSKQFKNYRKNVIEELGEEVDRQFRFNLNKMPENSEESENENGENAGEENSEKQNKGIVDQYSDYARIFCEGTPGWTKDPEHNMFYLKGQEKYCNDLLKIKGFMFLNDVYEILGFPKTKAGQIVGWRYDENNPMGDNIISFGLYDISKEAVARFVNGYERSIVLDFNVDGPIIDYI